VSAGVDLSRRRRIHVVGAGGAGMSAIATVLVAMGHTVSGSDQVDSAGVERLRAEGVDARIGHDAANLGDAELVAVSTAIPPTNVEVEAARRRGVPVLRRAEILAAIAATRRTVAVSGTHGKTTTTAMLATALLGAGLDPAFVVGGDLVALGSGARWSDGGLFVVEADESDGTFTELPAEVAVVTNVEADHLDHYGTLAGIEAAFATFLAQATAATVACADDPNAARLGREAGSLLYGTAPDAHLRILHPRSGPDGVHFELHLDGRPLGPVHVPLPGLHNARNATAAIAAAMALGAPFEACVTALASFGGVARRFQRRGEAGGVTVVDDYAHNPGKVQALLDSAAELGWRRVVCLFQPHRYSRTADLVDAFADAFGGADAVGMMDVYGAGEAPRPGVTGKLLLDAVIDRHPWRRLAWVPTGADALVWLRGELRPGDLCLTVGAGDVTDLGEPILAMLHQRAAAPGVGVR
jgi:UDP-N-acetylmuramate--alanine ligase